MLISLGRVFRKTALAVFLIFINQQNVFAEDQKDTLIFDAEFGWLKIKNIGEFYIEIVDEVGDGCWTSLRASRNAAEIEFMRSGYKIIEENSLSPIFVLSAIGYATNEYNCAVYQRVEVRVPDFSSWVQENYEITSIHFTQIYGTGQIMSGPKNNMSQRIKEGFVELTQEAIIQIERGYRKIIEDTIDASDPDEEVFWRSYFGE